MAKRNHVSGFVLIDAMIAFALVAVVLSAVYLVLPATASRQIERLNRLYAIEFAVSVLEEYRMTFPSMPTAGLDPSGWTWAITERKVDPDPPGSMAALITFHEVSVTVWHEDRPDSRHLITTIVARRRT